MRMLIGLSGKMGVGKNYISENIIPNILEKVMQNVRIFPISFADQIKVELAIRDNTLTYENLFIHKTNETRDKLQKYGTEVGRSKYGEDIWIKSVEMWMKIFNDRVPKKDNLVFIISDVRFKNEAEWIEKNNGLLIRIKAPNRNIKRIVEEKIDISKINHISEIDLDDYNFNNIINNDNIEEKLLINQTEMIIKKYLSNR